ncbi:MAG: hypothetical protein QXG35_08160, partial [Nitrososphaerota archaeon]
MRRATRALLTALVLAAGFVAGLLLSPLLPLANVAGPGPGGQRGGAAGGGVAKPMFEAELSIKYIGGAVYLTGELRNTGSVSVPADLELQLERRRVSISCGPIAPGASARILEALNVPPSSLIRSTYTAKITATAPGGSSTEKNVTVQNTLAAQRIIIEAVELTRKAGGGASIIVVARNIHGQPIIEMRASLAGRDIGAFTVGGKEVSRANALKPGESAVLNRALSPDEAAPLAVGAAYTATVTAIFGDGSAATQTASVECRLDLAEGEPILDVSVEHAGIFRRGEATIFSASVRNAGILRISSCGATLYG